MMKQKSAKTNAHSELDDIRFRGLQDESLVEKMIELSSTLTTSRKV